MKEGVLTAYKCEQSSFPLLDLPMPALAAVLRHLGWAQGAELAPLCRKLNDAFSDANTWRALCEQDFWEEGNLLSAFDASGLASWKEFYHQKVVWSIRIVTVFSHRGGRSLNGDFTMQVNPSMTLGLFLKKVKSHPNNAQTNHSVVDFVPTGLPDLAAHDPRRLGRRPECEEDPTGKPGGPNCGWFEQSRFWRIETHPYTEQALATPVKFLGLCNGAVLEQQEQLMCD